MNIAMNALGYRASEVRRLAMFLVAHGAKHYMLLISYAFNLKIKININWNKYIIIYYKLIEFYIKNVK